MLQRSQTSETRSPAASMEGIARSGARHGASGYVQGLQRAHVPAAHFFGESVGCGGVFFSLAERTGGFLRRQTYFATKCFQFVHTFNPMLFRGCDDYVEIIAAPAYTVNARRLRRKRKPNFARLNLTLLPIAA